MEKLDTKDKQILYQLDLNSKMSLRKIGHHVKLSKSVVQYRINRLVKEGIIKNFYTSIDFYRLGYINLCIHITYQYYTPEIENKIITHFKGNNETWFIANVQGKYDLLIMFTIKNLNKFFSFWKNTLRIYRYNIEQADISFIPKTYVFPKEYLLKKTLIHQKKAIVDGAPEIHIEEKDLKILHEISLNSRKPLTEIARKYDVSSVMIANRIKKLEKENIITGYKINIDYSKLGYQLFNVQYVLKNYNKIDKIIAYIKENPNIISINEVIGNWDLSCNYHIRNYHELHKIINDILRKFPNDIKNRITVTYPEIFKSNYMPTIKI
jgi:DNA-binding Lrp family transcriptional regulator